jgi:hypothetical protein
MAALASCDLSLRLFFLPIGMPAICCDGDIYIYIYIYIFDYFFFNVEIKTGAHQKVYFSPLIQRFLFELDSTY